MTTVVREPERVVILSEANAQTGRIEAKSQDKDIVFKLLPEFGRLEIAAQTGNASFAGKALQFAMIDASGGVLKGELVFMSVRHSDELWEGLAVFPHGAYGHLPWHLCFRVREPWWLKARAL